MVSDFRKKKINFVFSWFDTDKSGSISKQDFEQSAESIAKRHGWTAGDAKYQATKDTLLKVWAGLEAADSDKDGQITQEEWTAYWDKYGDSPAEWQDLYCKFIFDIEDVTGDGAIDAEEFATVNATFGVDKSVSSAAFQKMAKGKASVTFPEFQVLWKEFFGSDDPNAAGNFIFGRTTF